MLTKRELGFQCELFSHLKGQKIEDFWEVEEDEFGCHFVCRLSGGEVLFVCFDGPKDVLVKRMLFCKGQGLVISDMIPAVSLPRNEHLVRVDFDYHLKILIPLHIPIV